MLFKRVQIMLKQHTLLRGMLVNQNQPVGVFKYQIGFFQLAQIMIRPVPPGGRVRFRRGFRSGGLRLRGTGGCGGGAVFHGLFRFAHGKIGFRRKICLRGARQADGLSRDGFKQTRRSRRRGRYLRQRGGNDCFRRSRLRVHGDLILHGSGHLHLHGRGRAEHGVGHGFHDRAEHGVLIGKTDIALLRVNVYVKRSGIQVHINDKSGVAVFGAHILIGFVHGLLYGLAVYGAAVDKYKLQIPRGHQFIRRRDKNFKPQLLKKPAHQRAAGFRPQNLFGARQHGVFFVPFLRGQAVYFAAGTDHGIAYRQIGQRAFFRHFQQAGALIRSAF